MMDVDSTLHFHSKDEEIEYWMNVAHQMYQRKKEIERDLTDYQENSLLYEKELETSFEQSDIKNRNLHQKNEKLQSKNDLLKMRLNHQNATCTALHSQIKDIKLYNDELLKTVTALEQKNDDLERANRELKVAEEEMEYQQNLLLEKLAFIETELDDNQELKFTIQRLKDENTDLKHQIQIDALKRNENRLGVNINNMNPENYRNSIQSNISICELIQMEHDQMQKNLLQYVKDLEAKLVFLEKTNSQSKANEENLNVKGNIAVERTTQLERVPGEKEKFAGVQKSKDENRDLSQEAQANLRPHKEKSRDRMRPLSQSSKLQEDKRSSSSSRLNRHIEIRVKKVKDEEKRQQNLTWFLKRLRYSQPNWLRKREQN